MTEIWEMCIFVSGIGGQEVEFFSPSTSYKRYTVIDFIKSYIDHNYKYGSTTKESPLVIQGLLANGWEPYAHTVTEHGNGMYFKRKVNV